MDIVTGIRMDIDAITKFMGRVITAILMWISQIRAILGEGESLKILEIKTRIGLALRVPALILNSFP